MLKNAFKKYPPQNRTNVQIKGGGGQRPFEQCSKKLHFFERKASLSPKNTLFQSFPQVDTFSWTHVGWDSKNHPVGPHCLFVGSLASLLISCPFLPILGGFSQQWTLAMHLKERNCASGKGFVHALTFSQWWWKQCCSYRIKKTIPLKHYNFKFNVVGWEQNCMVVNKS